MVTTQTSSDLALIAHLMRRAGFGATRDELETYAAQGYDATLQWLLHPPEERTYLPDDILRRYHHDFQ
ncbi:MAG: hypothetical protein QGF59_19550, partial [Pirellulaceae bacterium]|nr:hypothetical protein [Pirellulaceae bacterium]